MMVVNVHCLIALDVFYSAHSVVMISLNDYLTADSLLKMTLQPVCPL